MLPVVSKENTMSTFRREVILEAKLFSTSYTIKGKIIEALNEFTE